MPVTRVVVLSAGTETEVHERNRLNTISFRWFDGWIFIHFMTFFKKVFYYY